VPGLKQYDVWSAFSMSYTKSKPGPLPALAPPLARLPPFCPTLKMRQRYTVKTTPAPASSIDEFGSPEGELPPKAEAGNEVKDEIEAGYEPQRLHLHNDTVSREAQSALEDIADLFLTKKDRSICLNLGFRCLSKNTRKVLRSIQKKRT
jgi:hypothetical protein